MCSMRRSFNNLNSYKHMGRDNEAEEAPILLDDLESPSNDLYRHPGVERDVVVLNIDENAGGVLSTTANNANGAENANLRRESSYGFWNDPMLVNVGGGGGISNDASAFAFRRPEDQPTNLIGQFLHKQRASGDVSLDVDLNMVELAGGAIPDDGSSRNPPMAASPTQSSKDLKVSFESASRVPNGEWIRRRTMSRKRGSDSSDGEDEEDHRSPHGDHDHHVVRCTSPRQLAAQRSSTLLRTKTKSRLMDPPRMMKQKSNNSTQSCVQDVRKSGLLKPGMVGKGGPVGDGDDEYDPFFDEDLPDDFKKDNVGVLTVLEWLSFVLIVAAFICTLAVPLLAEQMFWGLHLWKWALLLLVLFCGRLVSGWGIRLVVFFIERNFTLRKRLLYFVYGVRRSVQNSLWLGLVLISWQFMFDSTVQTETKSEALPYVTKVLVCFLMGTLIWLVKTLCVKSLASSFHVSVYFDRIQDSLFNQYVIETLSGPPLMEIKRRSEEEEKLMAEMKKLEKAGAKIPMDLRTAAAGRTDDPPIRSGPFEKCPRIGKNCRVSGAITSSQEEGITIDHLHRLNQKNVSAWNMKRLMKIVRHGVLSTTLDESVRQIGQEDEQTMQIQSEYQAKAAARKIFQNVAKPGAKCITLMDLMRFMSEEEAIKTMSLFEEEKDADRVISRSALKTWVVNAFIERRALALTLNDTKTAVNKLHQMVNIVVGIVIAVLWLLILGIATTHLLVFVSSQVLLVSFMFGNTCKTIFESMMFLFVMHPYDVGDRCEVDGAGNLDYKHHIKLATPTRKIGSFYELGEIMMIVEEMNILTTVFLRSDNLKITYPNCVLSTKPISNYYRSPDMGDSIDFCIHISTPAEKIAILKERIKSFIESKKDHWYPNPTVIVKDIEEINKLNMSVWLRHKANHQDMGGRHNRRALVVEEMIKVFRDLEIKYRMLPLDVNVQNMPPTISTRRPSTWTS